MSSERQTSPRGRYRRQLNQLRLKIDSLPDDIRPHFRAMLDEKEQECKRIQEEAQRTCDIADDLALAATHIAVHLEATWREATKSH